MIIGYELAAVSRAGRYGWFEVCCKAEVRERRAELRAWVNTQPKKYRLVCEAIYA